MKIGQFIEYKGYVGTIEYSSEDNIYHESLLNIDDSINYDGTSVEDLYKYYQEAVDFYIGLRRNYEQTCMVGLGTQE